MNISIDIETFSDVDLKKSGVYKYAESDNFEILLFAYSLDGSEVKVVDLASGEEIPSDIICKLNNPAVTKWAFNSQFERVCLSEYLRKYYPEQLGTEQFLNPRGWHCTMTWCAYLGLPLSLDKAGEILGLDKKKMAEGKMLITYFSKPCKPTKSNGGRVRNLPIHDKLKWDNFKNYNQRDVEVELNIQKRLQKYPVPQRLWEEFYLDQSINDRGIGIDEDFIQSAIAFSLKQKDYLMERLRSITGLENPNSVMQLKDWLKTQGMETESLDKKSVEALLPNTEGEVKEVLTLRLKLGKSSISKYQAMERARSKDNRVRGMFQFYGANRSGRWAGRIVQFQNLPQNHMADLEIAKELVKKNEYETFEILYSVQSTLSQLIRTAFIPKDNHQFIVADFSSIEARVLSFLAGEQWRNKLFAKGGDIYCQSASKMFGVPVEKHGINGHLRQKGKIAELACGYGGSVGALKAMGALDMGLCEEELKPLVIAWRTANSNIVEFWWEVDRAIKRAIREHTITSVGNIDFSFESNMLFIRLPSGRRLAYVKPKIEENKYGTESVTYDGLDITKKWSRIESYGPKFVENIVQGISRDLLAFALKKLKGFNICAHVHDEVIIETTKDVEVQEICDLMSTVPSWLKGIKLDADGYVCRCYQKR